MPFESALIATIVIMQVSIEVASKSVGENDSPLPLLSTGASVIKLISRGHMCRCAPQISIIIASILTIHSPSKSI